MTLRTTFFIASYLAALTRCPPGLFGVRTVTIGPSSFGALKVPFRAAVFFLTVFVATLHLPLDAGRLSRHDALEAPPARGSAARRHDRRHQAALRLRATHDDRPSLVPEGGEGPP